MNLDLPVREVMTADVQTIAADASLTDAHTVMVNGGFHHLPVVDGDALVGMLSAADLLAVVRAQPAELEGTGVVLDTEHTVRAMMTDTVVTVGIDTPIREAVHHFAEGAYHALPVVAGRRLVGIFTTRDLARHLLEPTG